jgi:hypothetical protein
MKRKKTGFGMIILMVLGTEALLFACQTQKKSGEIVFPAYEMENPQSIPYYDMIKRQNFHWMRRFRSWRA